MVAELTRYTGNTQYITRYAIAGVSGSGSYVLIGSVWSWGLSMLILNEVSSKVRLKINDIEYKITSYLKKVIVCKFHIINILLYSARWVGGACLNCTHIGGLVRVN